MRRFKKTSVRIKLMVALVVVLLLAMEAELPAGVSDEERQAAEKWLRTLTDLRDSNVPLPLACNELPVVFQLRDVPVLLRLMEGQDAYSFNIFMNVDRRGTIIAPGTSCYVEDFMIFETSRKIHIFVELRVPGIPKPVWTSLACLEYAVWGGRAP